MTWTTKLHPEFLPEFAALPEDVQDELLARLKVLQNLGPQLGRPTVDTLKGSMFANMKELRFNKDGVWRFAFAFDKNREAIVLIGGDKEDKDSDAFYKALIETADRRFAAHQASLEKQVRSRK